MEMFSAPAASKSYWRLARRKANNLLVFLAMDWIAFSGPSRINK
jgi:hypothetical protein